MSATEEIRWAVLTAWLDELEERLSAAEAREQDTTLPPPQRLAAATIASYHRDEIARWKAHRDRVRVVVFGP